MANYRQIHVSIWKDEWFLDLEPEEKLLFIYLFSNESTSLAGIYRIPMKVIAFETGLSATFIESTLQKFHVADKVHYENGVVWVVNMRQYHETRSTKVQTRIENDIASIPDCDLKIRYLYGMDTQTQLKEEEDEEEKEEEKKNSDDDFAIVVKAYENNIGFITPMTRDTLIDILTDTPPKWIVEAIQVAVTANVRRLSYVKGILARWKVQGFSDNGKAIPPSAIAGMKSAHDEP